MEGIQVLIGKTIVKIDQSVDTIVFTTDNGERYQMWHPQDCCESVTVEDIIGDLDDLLNTPILEAEERTSDESPADKPDHGGESQTWTFYHFGTLKGRVTIRWYGTSNGYYSESVYFEMLTQ